MTTTRRLVLISTALALALAPGCDKKEEHGKAGHEHHTDHHDTDEHGRGSEKEHAHGAEEKHGHGSDEEHAAEVQLSAESIARAGVRVEPVKKHVLSPVFTVPGRVTFNTEKMAHVGAAITGRVVEVKARVGDRVNAGDTLLILESSELGDAQSDLLVKTAALKTSIPAVDLTRASFERAKSLHEESKGIALNEVQKREADLRAAEAGVVMAKSTVNAARDHLRLRGMNEESIARLVETGVLAPRLAIKAPIAGEVVEREVTVGELVSPDRDALLILADLSSTWVVADLPEIHLSDVAVGAKVRVVATTTDSNGLEGVVAYIPPHIDALTHTASVRIEMHSVESTSLRPGMFAEVRIASSKGSSDAVLAVPQESVQTIDDASVVFVPVEGEANTFSKRVVQVGRAVGDLVPVHAGLSEGEQVVTSGTFIMKAELGKGSASHDH